MENKNTIIETAALPDDVVIRVENLSKIYKLYDSNRDRVKEAFHPFRKKFHRDFYALKDVSFEVKKGETVGIIGMNGSGKSTLLQVITGVLSPSSGSVKVKGKISALLELGAGFNPEFTGIENVYFSGQLMGYSREEIHEKLDDILTFADIGDFVYQPVKMYSSGMYVRLAFAVAINVDPDILIVDEALAVGDIRFLQKCIRKMNEIRKKGTTLLLVTHDTSTVQNMASNCYWLDGGTIKDKGIPKDVVKRYIAFMTYGLETKKNETTESGEYSKSREISHINSNSNIMSCDNEKMIKKQDKDDLPVNFELNSLPDSSWVSPQGCEGFGEGKAEIIRVAFLNKENDPIAQTPGGEYVYFLIDFISYDDLQDVIIGMTIRNRKGDAVLAINNIIYDIKFPRINVKDRQVSVFYFYLPKLAIGNYTISASIAVGTQLINTQLHWLHDVVVFDIITEDMKQRIGSVYANENVLIKLMQRNGVVEQKE